MFTIIVSNSSYCLEEQKLSKNRYKRQVKFARIVFHFGKNTIDNLDFVENEEL